MGQTWCDLLFAHWRVPPELLERVVPPQIPLDTFDGSAWLAVTPFEVIGLHPRLTPPLPLVSRFPEVNVRTYASVGGKPGIYFFSLDAGSSLAVAAARRFYRLPYFRARMRIQRGSRGVEYTSERRSPDGPPAALDARYRGVGPVFNAAEGSLEHFLTERYCLYTLDQRGNVLRGEIHHPPWPLQLGELELERNTMTAPLDIALDEDVVLHYSQRQDVLIWALREA